MRFGQTVSDGIAETVTKEVADSPGMVTVERTSGATVVTVPPAPVTVLGMAVAGSVTGA